MEIVQSTIKKDKQPEIINQILDASRSLYHSHFELTNVENVGAFCWHMHGIWILPL